MRILIFTEGGGKIGLGHISRCMALCQAFEEEKQNPVLIVKANKNIEAVLKGNRYEIFDWLKNKKKLASILKYSDITIIDSYLAGSKIYKLISKKVPLVVYIDDNKRIRYPKGIVVNGAIYARRLNYPREEKLIYLLGGRYALLRKAFWNLPKMKRINEDLKSIFVTFGGTDSRNLTPKVLKLLVTQYPNLVKKVVIGKEFKNINAIVGAKDSKTELIYYPGAQVIKKTMLNSDLAIAAGGQTLYELARVGVPTIAVAVADNQVNNAKKWERLGFIRHAGNCDEKRLVRRIAHLVCLLKDKVLRLQMSRVGRKLIDGRGANRIAKYILERAAYRAAYRAEVD